LPSGGDSFELRQKKFSNSSKFVDVNAYVAKLKAEIKRLRELLAVSSAQTDDSSQLKRKLQAAAMHIGRKSQQVDSLKFVTTAL
jgi:outer membrane murein-binding lipoprotein Lpp